MMFFQLGLIPSTLILFSSMTFKSTPETTIITNNPNITK
jgi:hypothetical protein